MHAEEPHRGCLVAWPADRMGFGSLLDAARREVADVVARLVELGPVTVATDPGDAAGARERSPAGIDVVERRFEGAWRARHGMVELAPGEWIAPGVLSCDGTGRALATAPSLLGDGRSAADVAAGLQPRGVRSLVWLPHGFAEHAALGEPVRSVARCTGPGRVVVLDADSIVEAGGDARNRATLRDNRRLLAKWSFEVHDVPCPRFGRVGGRSVPVSPLDGYVADGAVVVPVATGSDAVPPELAAAWPGRTLLPVPAPVLAAAGGLARFVHRARPSADDAPPDDGYVNFSSGR